MGTLFRIVLYAPDEASAQSAFRAAFDRVHELDEALSDYKPESELMRMCREASRHPVHVSDDLYRVLEASQKLAEQTDGAFDITLGPVVRLWRQARKEKRLPDAASLEQAGEHCGYRNLVLDQAAHTAFLKKPDMILDLGGIAKGYTADEVIRLLQERGIFQALVAASGDIVVSDAPPGKKGWAIGIDSLDSPVADFTGVLTLSHAAVSTSGDTEQFVEIEGQRYSHIVDPKTKIGLTNRLAVTVVAKQGIDADGLDTTISVMGPKRGIAFIEQNPDAAALMVNINDKNQGPPEVVESSRFKQLRSR